MDHPPDATSLLHHFAALNDPRQRAKVVYPLPEILLLVLCATIVGAEDFVGDHHGIGAQPTWISSAASCRHKDGIPSHDALNDLINALHPKLFSECFIAWVSGLRDGDPDIVAIDGKTSRRTHARSKRDASRCTWISAWASAASGSSSGRKRRDVKSNEITAIPLLLQRLELKGALVTIDAMGCQTKIAATILERGCRLPAGRQG